MQQFCNVRGLRCVDDAGGDELVHSFVVGRVRGIVDESGAAGIDAAGKEGHTKRFVVGDTLKRAEDVSALEVLCAVVSVMQAWTPSFCTSYL